jgi:hypothetical protein
VAPTPTGPKLETPWSARHARLAGPPSERGWCAIATDEHPSSRITTKQAMRAIVVF